MSTIPVRKIVNVSVLVSAVAPAAPSFSRCLGVGVSARLPTYDRLRLYNDMDGVAVDFQSTDPEYLLAQKWFSQSPRPNEFMIGRCVLAPFAGSLRSGARSELIALYQAVTNGGFDTRVDGTLYHVTGVDLHDAADLADVAAAVQVALRSAGATDSTVIDNDTQFVVTSGTTGVSSTVNYCSSPAYPYTDLSALMGLTAGQGAGKVDGGAAESVVDSLTAFNRIDGSWYGFECTKERTDDELLAASVWAEANSNKFHFITYSSPVAYDSGSTADLGYRLKAAQLTHTLIQFSSTTDYAVGLGAAKLLQVSYDQINSTITLEFKQEPTVTPENLSATQYNALEAKNYCYLGTVSNGFVMIFNTKTPSGRFVDEVVNIDWFQADMQNNVFTALATSPTKVPQTDKGMEVLLQAASKTCEKAVRNRMAAPGTWTHDGFGALVTGDFLQQGYYLYAPPVASQSDADRAARKTPPIQGALIGAGAFHSVDIVVNFQR
jgi:hypothetical protein